MEIRLYDEPKIGKWWIDTLRGDILFHLQFEDSKDICITLDKEDAKSLSKWLTQTLGDMEND